MGEQYPGQREAEHGNEQGRGQRAKRVSAAKYGHIRCDQNDQQVEICSTTHAECAGWRDQLVQVVCR